MMLFTIELVKLKNYLENVLSYLFDKIISFIIKNNYFNF